MYLHPKIFFILHCIEPVLKFTGILKNFTPRVKLLNLVSVAAVILNLENEVAEKK